MGTLNKFLIVLIVLFQTACKSSNEEAKTLSVEEISDGRIRINAIQYQNLNIQLADVRIDSFSQVVVAQGIVDVPPENIASVNSMVPGVIKKITHNVLPGKYVSKGAILAEAESMELVQYQQEYLEAFLKNELLIIAYDRQKALVEKDAGVERMMQEAENAWKLNEGLMNSLRAKLSMTHVNISEIEAGNITSKMNIIAPISGYIKDIYINIGSHFTDADKLYEIISREHLHVELKVFEKDANKLKLGQTVLFKASFLPENTSGSIFLIAKNFDEESKAINVHVHLNNEAAEESLIPGQYLSGNILINSRYTRVIEESALFQDGNNRFVYRINAKNDGEVVIEKVAVEINEIQNGFAEVISPEDLTDVIIQGGNLLSGMSEGE